MKVWDHFSQCTKCKHDTPPHSFSMADRGKKRYSVGEALEAVFADEDSGDENFDCGSDAEVIPDSENDSCCEDSDLDDSINMPSSTHMQEVEEASRSLIGTYFYM